MERAHDCFSRLAAAYDGKVVGQVRLRTSLLVTMLAEGHILLESVPGLAKTTAASTLAERGQRVVRPDPVHAGPAAERHHRHPGVRPRNREFGTRLGPVHANFVLLDEINRSSAKTQSAMLEAMQERQTSIGGLMYPLPQPFMVLATQNPIEEEGTYLLPKAQIDRFLLKEVIDYPTADEELEVLNRIDSGVLGAHAAEVTSAVELPDVLFLIDLAVARVRRRVGQALRRGDHPGHASHGDGDRSRAGRLRRVRRQPAGRDRAAAGGRAFALLNGRTYVVPEDLRALRHSVLRHRLQLGFQAVADDVNGRVDHRRDLRRRPDAMSVSTLTRSLRCAPLSPFGRVSWSGTVADPPTASGRA